MKPFMNSRTQSLGAYASKAISMRAKSDPDVVNLAIGEPDFGPPEHLVEAIQAHHLSYSAFLNGVKQYETSRGLRELRHAIAEWYLARYDFQVDPDTEILITHGGVEAIALAILCTSDPADTILITDPTYMLYRRSIENLGRVALSLARTTESEYLGMIADTTALPPATLSRARALIVNSPENPTGYVISGSEWKALAEFAQERNLWIIHGEVYDSMAFARPHLPARCIPGLTDRSILVNSFSKKFGVPGLRIGWLCAKPELVSLAAKLHDYLYLGVNILCEHVALTLLSDPISQGWLDSTKQMLESRIGRVVGCLDSNQGYCWERRPLGGMFAFPDVQGLAQTIPQSYLSRHPHAGDAVAGFLLEEHKVAVVPGSTYGPQGNNCIRLVLCGAEATVRAGIGRLSAAMRVSAASGASR
jgi:aspartate/methionine/tyrosine aminotransferase